ncbi:MAG: zinc-ribbon domain-containing protein [Faecousia sp.]
MICSKCGTDNPEEATFCTECGEPLAKPVNGEQKMDPIKKKKLIRIGALIVAAIVLIVIVLFIFSSSKAEGAAEDLCDALVQMDLNTALDLLPPAVVNYISGSLDLENVRYEIIRSEELSDDYVWSINERYSLRFGTDSNYIESAYVVYLRAAVSDRAISRDEIQLIMVEIDGDWYLDPLSTMDELDEAELDEDAFHINWD